MYPRGTESEADLFAACTMGDDPRARERAREALVERFLPLAQKLAQRYSGRGGHTETLDDLVQVASLGLIKAIDGFDPDRGLPFTSYAIPTILGELKRHFRDHGWAVHVPRKLQERVLEVDRAVERLAEEFGRTPSASEIAEDLGIELDAVLEALQASDARSSLSLDQPLGGDEEEGSSHYERIGAEDPGFASAERRVALADLLAVLPGRERLVVQLRFGEDLTQAEIGERIGVSQMQISRLLRSALTRLRLAAEEQGAEDGSVLDG